MLKSLAFRIMRVLSILFIYNIIFMGNLLARPTSYNIFIEANINDDYSAREVSIDIKEAGEDDGHRDVQGKNCELRILDKYGNVVWRGGYDVYFDYETSVHSLRNGTKGAAYSTHYKDFYFSAKIHFDTKMEKIVFLHDNKIIFSRPLLYNQILQKRGIAIEEFISGNKLISGEKASEIVHNSDEVRDILSQRIPNTGISVSIVEKPTPLRPFWVFQVTVQSEGRTNKDLGKFYVDAVTRKLTREPPQD